MVSDDEWRTRWSEGRIGFHQSEANPDLARWLPRLAPSATRVLVPLCGKSLDLKYLAEHGHEVVGVELVQQAAQAFFDENRIPFTRDDEADHVVYRAGDIELHVDDILRVPSPSLGLLGAVYDRAALIALPPETRPAYAERMKALLPAGCRMLLITLAYDQALVDGPPYSVSDDEVRSLYGDAGALELLEQRAAHDVPARFAEQGAGVSTSVWLLTRR